MAGPITFGRYVLLDKLALGGMAEIFLAKAIGEAGFEKALVIKRVLPHLVQAPGFVEMFLDEARIAAQLSHPGIVQIFDLGKQDGDYYFAMEYLAGEDLSGVLRRCDELKQRIPVDVAVKIAASAAEALHYAHQFCTPDGRPMGIVHRDISPSNLFVTYHGMVKLLDFGIARAEQRLQQTRAGHVKGKAAYMAPEQARGETVDCRADVWSLGVCLHEMVTGRRLFLRDNSGETLLAVREGPIPLPSSVRPEVPPELDALIMSALERDLAKRCPDAETLRRGLERYLIDRTYVSQSVQLGRFLRELFGEARAESQLRRGAVSSGRKTHEGTESLAPHPAPGDHDASTIVGPNPLAPNAAAQPLEPTAFGRSPRGEPPESRAPRPTANSSRRITELEHPATPPEALPSVVVSSEALPPEPMDRRPVIIGGVIATVVLSASIAIAIALSSSSPESPAPRDLTRPVAIRPEPEPEAAAEPAARTPKSQSAGAERGPMNAAEAPTTGEGATVAEGSEASARGESSADADNVAVVDPSEPATEDAADPSAESARPEDRGAETDEAQASAATKATPERDGAQAAGSAPVTRVATTTREGGDSRDDAAGAARSVTGTGAGSAPQPPRMAASTRAVAAASADSRGRTNRAAPAKAAPGWLTVRANVPVTAWLDGKRIGELPIESATVAPGPHKLRLENPQLGIVRHERIVVVSGKETLHEISLKKGKLNVLVDPWADVFVGATKLGQTPLAGRELYEGRYQVRLVGPKGEKSVSIDVVAGKTVVLRETLP